MVPSPVASLPFDSETKMAADAVPSTPSQSLSRKDVSGTSEPVGVHAYSQPFGARRSTSNQPIWHDATRHVLDAHSAVACGRLHALLQAPQCATSSLVRYSHPSRRLLPLQSAKPGSQGPTQEPAAHAAMRCALLHCRPQ